MTLAGEMRCLLQQILEVSEGDGPVLFQGTGLLADDAQFIAGGEPFAREHPQPLLDGRGQALDGRERQMQFDAGVLLVDVLAAGAGRSRDTGLDGRERDAQGRGGNGLRLCRMRVHGALAGAVVAACGRGRGVGCVEGCVVASPLFGRFDQADQRQVHPADGAFLMDLVNLVGDSGEKDDNQQQHQVQSQPADRVLRRTVAGDQVQPDHDREYG